MKCPECGARYVSHGWTSRTLLGYSSPAGHDHDDNCQNRTLMCSNGHRKEFSKRNRCSNPSCDWVGKDSCFCHEGLKVDEWPNETEADIPVVEQMKGNYFRKDGSFDQEKFARNLANQKK